MNINLLQSRIERLERSMKVVVPVAEFLVAGAVRSIPKAALLTAFTDALDGIGSTGAHIVRNAVASREAGKMLSLYTMLQDESE